MLVGLLLAFLVGAAAVYQGSFTTAGIISMIIAGLLAVEHSLNGYTEVPVTSKV
jgi:hypothetical protein